MATLLDSGTAFTAAFAFNDTLALGAMHRLQEVGLRVPDDVSIIGFDDIDDGEYSMPTLTTVDGGRRRLAERAVEVLQARIADPEAPARLHETDFRVVERGSAAPPSPAAVPLAERLAG
jgi:DNA-binding LacI/PurR family transcriptional regulator